MMLLLFLFACEQPQQASYFASCDDVICPGADLIEVHDGAELTTTECTWWCASYEDEPPAFVSLRFEAWYGECNGDVDAYVGNDWGCER